MEKSEEYKRSLVLKEKFNFLWGKILKNETDYFNKLSNQDLLNLKYTLANINNIITLKVTYLMAEWLFLHFNIDDVIKEKVLNEIEQTKPNANGYDIRIPFNGKFILAEIKTNIINNRTKSFGVNQINGILDDAHRLIHGKKKDISNTAMNYKFIGILHIEGETEKALEKVFGERKLHKPNDERIKRNQIKATLEIIQDDVRWDQLSTEKVYIKKINL